MGDKIFTLPKEERVCRKLIIDKLFSSGESFLVYPLRIVYLTSVDELEAPVAMMVSVSKKRFKRAVKRNYIKRRIREAYRLNKHKLEIPSGLSGVAIAFLYLSSDLKDFELINLKMVQLIDQLNKRLCSGKS